MNWSSLSEILEKQALQFGQKKCIVESISGKSLSYSELDFLAKRFAKIFSNQSSNKQLVGLLSDKCLEGVASIFGIYYSSSAFVPLPIDSPDDRLKLIFEECELDFLCVHEDLLDDRKKILIDYTKIGKLEGLHIYSSDKVISRKLPPDLSYILYTSGSTGQPKGVMHGDKQVLHFLKWSLTTFDLKSEDVFSSIAPFNFDLSVFDLYASVAAGGTLILFEDKAVKNPRYLAQLISDYQISIWYSTPSLFRLLVRHGKMEKYTFDSMKEVLFAGEVLFDQDVKMVTEIWKNAQTYNLYGPTETNVCTWHKVDGDAQNIELEESLPIGLPCEGMSYALTGKDHNEGELIIGGPTVALGYFSSSLNKEKFFVENGLRWYSTGDWVKRDSDGKLYYQRRIDRMVKRRGYRIELNEIEKVIVSHGQISEGAAVAIIQKTEMVIKAFVVTTAELNSLELNEFISTKLPSYMLPDEIVFMEDLPKTSSQKVDLKALEKH